jgi:hypothetical protein
MAEFRLYFCDGDDHIIARVEFCARDDGAGLAIAAAIAEASIDMHGGYMVWQGKRLLYASREPVGSARVRRLTGSSMNPGPIDAEQQDKIIRLEESLLQSHWRIAKSMRLLEATSRLRDKQATEKCARKMPRAS